MSERTDQIKSSTVKDWKIQATQDRALLRLRLSKKYPFAKDWTLDNLLKFERNALPVSVNGTVLTPTTYTPKESYISKDTKTESQHEADKQRAKLELEKSRLLKEQEQASEIINHPDNPIGWIPGVRTLFNVGADLNYRRLTGERFSPYTVNAALSAGLDATMLGFAPMKSYVGSYVGSVLGGVAGDLFDYPNLGRFVGGMIGGFTPLFVTSNGLKLGNNYYQLSYIPQGTLSASGLGELSGIRLKKVPLWYLMDFPGFLIKSLFKGSPLEKLLSKQGTISFKQLQAYIGRNDVSAIDKELIGRVLLNHINDTYIDYNTLRLEVLNMIPLFNRIPLNDYATYGIERLGFSRAGNSSYRGNSDYEQVPFEGLKLNTYTFESPYINGNDTHYNIGTLGHSRTYTTLNEPNILHVIESLSDWALSRTPFKPRFRYQLSENGNTNILFDKNGNFYYTSDGEGMPYKNFMDISLPNDKFPFNIAKTLYNKKALNVEKLIPYMQKTYLNRLLQENLRYAALNGQTKMRYPTSETAAKIEGYKGIPTSEYEQILDDLEHLDAPTLDLNIKFEIERLKLKKLELERTGKHITYPSSLQTILKKYSDFPKQYKKLFNAEVRTVVDNKGNSWYEVDIPLNYLNGTAEMLFKKGGKLKYAT